MIQINEDDTGGGRRCGVRCTDFGRALENSFQQNSNLIGKMLGSAVRQIIQRRTYADKAVRPVV